jgi:hypothetical protein
VRQEVGSADQIHREEDLVALGHHQLVGAHEVRVMNVGESPELLLEAVEPRRGEVEQSFESDGLATFAIEGLVDDSHPAFADATYDVVAFVASPLRCPRRLDRGVSRQSPTVSLGCARRIGEICPHRYRIGAYRGPFM